MGNEGFTTGSVQLRGSSGAKAACQNPERKTLVRSRRTSGGHRNGLDRGGQGRENGVEFPSSIGPRAGRGGTVREIAPPPNRANPSGCANRTTRRDGWKPSEPKTSFDFHYLGFYRHLVRGALRVAARPCSARRRIPTIPCGPSCPAMVNERLTAGIGSAAASLRREDGLSEPERRTLARSRHTSGGHRNGSDRGGQGSGNGVEFPSSSSLGPVAAGRRRIESPRNRTNPSGCSNRTNPT